MRESISPLATRAELASEFAPMSPKVKGRPISEERASSSAAAARTISAEFFIDQTQALRTVQQKCDSPDTSETAGGRREMQLCHHHFHTKEDGVD